MKWFKHETSSLHDAKIEKLIMKYGIEGYGLYFACVEIIAGELTSEHITFELEHDSEVLASKFKMQQTRVEEIMKYCIDLKLFEVNETSNKITCLKLMKRLDISTSNSPEFRKLLESISDYKKLLPINSRTEQKRTKQNRTEHKKFIPPTIEEFKLFFKEKGYREDIAEKAYNHYDYADWIKSNGDPVLNWKQTLNTNWFKPENKIAQKNKRIYETIPDYTK